MKTTYRHERVRHFQPPWRSVMVITCGACNNETRMRVPSSGVFPPGAVRCDCGEQLTIGEVSE